MRATSVTSFCGQGSTSTWVNTVSLAFASYRYIVRREYVQSASEVRTGKCLGFMTERACGVSGASGERMTSYAIGHLQQASLAVGLNFVAMQILPGYRTRGDKKEAVLNYAPCYVYYLLSRICGTNCRFYRISYIETFQSLYIIHHYSISGVSVYPFHNSKKAHKAVKPTDQTV